MRRTLSTLLLSSMLFTAAAYASDDASASTPRVSTGVTPPEIIKPLSIRASDQTSSHPLPIGSMIAVSFIVDETGTPKNIQILKGSDPYWNSVIASAVQNLRYRPASINHHPVAMGVNLNVNLN